MQQKKTIKNWSELPTMPSTIGTMVWNQTGDWRYLTPLIKNKLAPCSQNCPLGIPIPGYLDSVKNAHLEAGLTILLNHNPLPGLTGRLCYHPCQGKCVRKRIDRAISIQQIERFMADLSADVKIKKSEKKDKRVTIIGSGPLGLSCAYYLGREGFQVTVLDAGKQAGGALVDAQSKKIEPQVLKNEISRLIRMADIKLETDAVFNFEKPAELLSKADLVIIDPTGFSEEPGAPAGATTFNPLDDEEISGDIIAVTLPKNMKPFKAVMIAHYIAAGRLAAEKASAYFVKRSGKKNLEKREQNVPLQAVSADNIRIERFITASDLAAEAEAKQEGTWVRERVLQEAGRCLSCGTCNLCLQCVSFCPDASILQNKAKTTVAIDLDHCKGCGICAYECPRGVITMEDMNV